MKFTIGKLVAIRVRSGQKYIVWRLVTHVRGIPNQTGGSEHDHDLSRVWPIEIMHKTTTDRDDRLSCMCQARHSKSFVSMSKALPRELHFLWLLVIRSRPLICPGRQRTCYNGPLTRPLYQWSLSILVWELMAMCHALLEMHQHYRRPSNTGLANCFAGG